MKFSSQLVLKHSVGIKTLVTAITYMRFGKFLQRPFKKEMNDLVESHDRHVAVEGENLKRISEGRNNINPIK